MSRLIEAPARRDPGMVATEGVLRALGEAVAAGHKTVEPSLRRVAKTIVTASVSAWTEKAAGELTAALEAAVVEAVRRWKAQERDIGGQVAKAVAASHTQDEIDRWVAAVTERVMAEVDARGLISTQLLEGIHFTRPARKGEKGPKTTDAVECTDEEFLAWWAGQIGANGFTMANRLRVRLLLLGALEWVRGLDGLQGLER